MQAWHARLALVCQAPDVPMLQTYNLTSTLHGMCTRATTARLESATGHEIVLPPYILSQTTNSLLNPPFRELHDKQLTLGTAARHQS
jgi:hypothetical protein